MNWPFSVSSFNKHLLQKGIICLNLVRIWYIFPTRTFVLNAVKEPGIFFFFFFWGGGGGGGVSVRANKSLLDCGLMHRKSLSILAFPQRVLDAK